MMKILFLLISISLVGCSSLHSAGRLQSCYLKPTETDDISSSNSANSEIELKAIFINYSENPKRDKVSNDSIGFLVKSVKEASYYDSIGIQSGDVITEIDGATFKFDGKDLLNYLEKSLKLVFTIKDGKNFKLQRCQTLR